MVSYLSAALFAAATFGLAALLAQGVCLRRHLRGPAAVPRRFPPISVLKPLCGVDDGLEENLATFAAIDYPDYEVVLGVRSPSDPAWPVARAAVGRWPRRFRAVLQRGEPGLNPKVNQLVTLARAARHDLLVVSDSNVRVAPGYLREVAALLEDPAVGLVTHPIAGVGERRLGSLMDHLHLAGAVAPGVVGAKRLAGRDIVVGKSMALRRADLAALGGFEVVKDVLAEDYVMGLLVPRQLGKRVVMARQPILDVSSGRTVGEFAARYQRWGVLQRQAVGPSAYAARPRPPARSVVPAPPRWRSTPPPGGRCGRAGSAGVSWRWCRPRTWSSGSPRPGASCTARWTGAATGCGCCPAPGSPPGRRRRSRRRCPRSARSPAPDAAPLLRFGRAGWRAPEP
jgi:ceramide glucosyltransferase